ncbi:hypothetical protein F5X68DRAFT_167459 [Plectosphaerella plurivora]|uniref:Xylanolytic transcriptional activator regulatory domain-containing protein n=1 Tax=Plectosphaerella plurivora TaxID=936078 RepID=A0A9P9AEJ2_9PEZI|nr:hypothetical protein F5X68DRAFT_167459 [Plectosphaerella plurivora]
MDVDTERPQKRMRKGTKSCAECERRKIGCKYLPGFNDCAQCSVRGSKCTSQGLTGPDEGPEGKPVAPSSGRAGPTVDSVTPQRTSEIDDFDLEISAGSRPPFVSMFEPNKVSHPLSPFSMPELTKMQTTSSGVYEREAAQKPSNLCGILRANLPSYDVVISALAKNGAWWDSFRQKTRVVTQAGLIEPILSFAAGAYTSPSPAKLGILVVAYGRSMGSDPEAHRLFRLVDDLVISSMAAGSSLNGMECLVLLAKTYTDIGQPRRAWLMWRKGLATAQLLGLHRFASGPADRRQRIWMTIYHGDRFTSLLLGLPHGFSDSHLIDAPSSGGAMAGTFEQFVTKFVHDCTVVTGKVIESILLPSKPSFATAMQLDEKLETAFSSAPPGWWDLPMVESGSVDDSLVDKLLIQFYFFHVRLYTNLPFLKSDAASPSHNVSRAVCTEAARSLLQRYILLRSKVNGAWLFDCKTSDFVGFTAAVVLLIGTRGFGEQSATSQDEGLLRQAGEIFNELQDGGCRMASQCRRALALLSRPTHGDGPSKIFIPYFGTVRLPERTSSQNHRRRTPETSSTISSATTLAPSGYHGPSDCGLSIDYNGYQSKDMFAGGDWADEGLVEDHSATFQGFDVTSLDIDQDWSLFLHTTES